MRKEPQSEATARSKTEHSFDARLLNVAIKILTPLARLAVSAGVRLPQLEEILKRALLDAGRLELERAGIRVNKSRLSVSTGVHRKDVKRILDAAQADRPVPVGAPSASSLLYTHWSAAPSLRQDGKPMVLPYRVENDAPSFESLARQFTTDAHPRTLLDEMLRLGLVSLDSDTDEVTLNEKGFVPDKDGDEILELLGSNVGDHLSTAVANVLQINAPRLEQSLFERKVSPEAAAILERRSRELWHGCMAELVPLMEELGELDKTHGRTADQRIRIGMYAFWEEEQTSSDKTPPATDRAGHDGQRGGQE